MAKNMKYYNLSKISELEEAVKALGNCTNEELFDSFLTSTNIVFYNVEDKAKEHPICFEDFFNMVKRERHEKRTPEFAQEILQEFIDSKKEYKNDAIKLDILKRTKGPKYTKDELELSYKDIELRDELIKQNAKDINLFMNFKLCGDQMVLVDDDDCELLTEDLQGRITIDNVHWIKPNGIAYRVKKTFMEKISMYYKMFSEFLATLDINDLEVDLNNEIIETPIEDYIETTIPTSFITLYRVQAVYESYVDSKGKQHKVFKYFRLKRNPRIETFDDIFQYVLENWKKYKSMIYGQEQFKAWTNNPNEISVSHWIPEKVTTMPLPWKEFLEEKMPDEHFRKRLITFMGMCIDAENTTQQYLIISDQGGTGKGVMMRALECALPKNSISNIDQGVLSDSNEFGMAGVKIWNSHISVLEEYSDNTLTSDKAKKLIANNIISLNVKGKAHVRWEPINHKLIVFSNKKATIKEFANRRRAIPITFAGQYKWTKEKQEGLNSTAKDFLNYCYNVYKDNNMFINNYYKVMSKEDEIKYLEDPTAFDNVTDDALTKRAFNEDMLKDFFNTDEYADTEDYIDFENFFNVTFTETDYEHGLSAKELRDVVKLNLNNNVNEEYRMAFEYDINGQTNRDLNTRSKAWWKWLSYLNTAHNVKAKKMNINGKTVAMYNINLLATADHFATDEEKEKFAKQVNEEMKEYQSEYWTDFFSQPSLDQLVELSNKGKNLNDFTY